MAIISEDVLSLNVLLVEDDQVDRIAVRRLLQRGDSELTVLESIDRESCLRQIAAHPVDCIIMDYYLPGDDGLQIMQALRERAVDIPVIVLTGRSDEELASSVLGAGAADYLEKDGLDATRLQSTVTNVIRAKQHERRASQFLNALRILSEGTAGVVGDDFFPALVHHLGMALGAKHAWVAQLEGDGSSVVTLAYWGPPAGGARRWRCHLAGTPCVETLMGDGFVQQDEVMLQLTDAEDERQVREVAGSFMAMPLRQDDHKPLGLLVVIGAPLLSDYYGAEMVLSIFARRAVLELDRPAVPSALQRTPANPYLPAYADFLTELHRQGDGETGIRQALAALRASSGDDRILCYGHRERDGGGTAFRLVGHDSDERFLGTSFVNAEAVPYRPHFARWASALEHVEPLHVQSTDCPESERRLLQAEGVVSCLIVPAIASTGPKGFLRVDALEQERTWDTNALVELQRVADMLAISLQRLG